MRLQFAILGLILVVISAGGCGEEKSGEDRIDPTTAESPEHVFRQFLLNQLDPDESKIQPLILHHPEASILWSEGTYPAGVKEMLEEQYRSGAVKRIKESANRVVVESDALPFPIEIVRVGKSWKVDASKIIELRMKAKDR